MLRINYTRTYRQTDGHNGSLKQLRYLKMLLEKMKDSPPPPPALNPSFLGSHRNKNRTGRPKNRKEGAQKNVGGGGAIFSPDCQPHGPRFLLCYDRVGNFTSNFFTDFMF